MQGSVSSSAQMRVRGSRHKRGVTPHPRWRRLMLRVLHPSPSRGEGKIGASHRQRAASWRRGVESMPENEGFDRHSSAGHHQQDKAEPVEKLPVLVADHVHAGIPRVGPRQHATGVCAVPCSPRNQKPGGSGERRAQQFVVAKSVYFLIKRRNGNRSRFTNNSRFCVARDRFCTHGPSEIAHGFAAQAIAVLPAAWGGSNRPVSVPARGKKGRRAPD